MIGTTIDATYQVERLIGEGGFGVVYECTEISLDRRVAVKVLNTMKAGPRDVERFLGEARRLASLNHPNVVQIHRLGGDERTPYIVMELLQGRTLRQALRHSRLPLADGLGVMRQVASGLGAIHAMGLVHRDLSTNNIMVCESGVAKILDLGMTREADGFSSLSHRGDLVGTLPYLAPEQINGHAATRLSEIFSFGIILYEVATGQYPFQAEHHMSILYGIAQRDPVPPEDHLSNCPPALSELILGCLEKSPAHRPQKITEVEASLGRILALSDLSSSTPRSPGTSLVEPRSSSRNPYLHRTMIKRSEDFFGRKQELKRIYARLNATPPGSISVVGDRKIGKSSLLNYVYSREQRRAHLEQPERMVMVFLDLQEEKGMSMEVFVKTLLGIANYELRGRLDVSDCALSLDGIKDLVQRLDRHHFRLAILLDEFDCVTTNANFDLEFFSFLRYLANHYNVAYLTSSARDLQELCHTKEISDSPFFNIFSTLRLSTFQREEAEELIRIPSERVGRPLAEHADSILEIAGLFPFYIQMACSHVIEFLDEAPNRKPEFAEIRRRFYEEAKLHYRYLWENFDPHERSAVLRVARHKRIPDALQHIVGELESRHYVSPAHQGGTLFSSMFEEFVKREGSKGDARGGPSLLGRLLGRGGASQRLPNDS